MTDDELCLMLVFTKFQRKKIKRLAAHASEEDLLDLAEALELFDEAETRIKEQLGID